MKKLSGGQFRPRTTRKPVKSVGVLETPKAAELRASGGLIGVTTDGRSQFYVLAGNVWKVTTNRVDAVGSRQHFDSLTIRGLATKEPR